MAAKMLRLLRLSKSSYSLFPGAVTLSSAAHVPEAGCTQIGGRIPQIAWCSSSADQTSKSSHADKRVTTDLLSTLKGTTSEKSSQERFHKFCLEDLQAQWEDSAPIWSTYRRNHKGQLPPARTRRNCFRGKHVCGNPCPICQLKVKKNYTINAEDVVLLSQFICPHTGNTLDTSKTGVCRQQQKNLVAAIKEAQNRGLLPFTIPGPRDPPKQFREAGMPAPNIRNKT